MEDCTRGVPDSPRVECVSSIGASRRGDPLGQRRRNLYTPIEINGVLTLHFILDTGASDVQISADVALTLIRTGTIQSSDFLPGRTYTLADGTTVQSPRFILRSLKIGTRLITQVPASIGNLYGALLLGQSVLERLGTWSMDSQRRMLVLGPATRRDGLFPPERALVQLSPCTSS